MFLSRQHFITFAPSSPARPGISLGIEELSPTALENPNRQRPRHPDQRQTLPRRQTPRIRLHPRTRKTNRRCPQSPRLRLRTPGTRRRRYLPRRKGQKNKQNLPHIRTVIPGPPSWPTTQPSWPAPTGHLPVMPGTDRASQRHPHQHPCERCR